MPINHEQRNVLSRGNYRFYIPSSSFHSGMDGGTRAAVAAIAKECELMKGDEETVLAVVVN